MFLRGAIARARRIAFKSIGLRKRELLLYRDMLAHFSFQTLAEMKNSADTDEVFIIANGPSLSADDLDLIADFPTIASNLIHLIFHATSWRPTYYSCVDSLVARKLVEALKNSDWVREDYLTSRARFFGWDVPGEAFQHGELISKRLGTIGSADFGFSDDLTRGYFNGKSVTYFNLQLAAHLGFRKIFLLGLDHSYAEGTPNRAGLVATTQVNHFSPDYRHRGELAFHAPITAITDAYEAAREWASRNDVEIVNVSRTSRLDVFPRLKLEDATAHKLRGKGP